MSAVIGRPLDRVDGHLKVTGGARYAAEFAVPHLAYGVLVQSTESEVRYSWRGLFYLWFQFLRDLVRLS